MFQLVTVVVVVAMPPPFHLSKLTQFRTVAESLLLLLLRQVVVVADVKWS